MQNHEHDNVFFNILEDRKTLPNFLDAVFGFLKRRTDFYCIAPDKSSPIGLPEGFAEYFVQQAFNKWRNDDDDSVDLPLVIEEVEVTSTNEENVDPVVEHVENKPFTSSDSYNGRVFDNYSWSQTITDVNLIVMLPENVTIKDITVSILPQTIKIVDKNTNTVIVEGELYQKVKNRDAIWSLDKRKLEIHLDKSLEMWWDCFFTNEPKLDLSEIDCSRPFQELPEDAQAKIEELSWNQERKRLGLATSEEIILQEKLKKGWHAEGSPFKGPFDPDLIRFN